MRRKGATRLGSPKERRARKGDGVRGRGRTEKRVKRMKGGRARKNNGKDVAEVRSYSTSRWSSCTTMIGLNGTECEGNERDDLYEHQYMT